jgi:hypothetical protein
VFVAVSSRLVAADGVYNDVEKDVDETVEIYLYRNSRRHRAGEPASGRRVTVRPAASVAT